MLFNINVMFFFNLNANPPVYLGEINISMSTRKIKCLPQQQEPSWNASGASWEHIAQ